jgi:hypothetical protein
MDAASRSAAEADTGAAIRSRTDRWLMRPSASPARQSSARLIRFFSVADDSDMSTLQLA